MSPLEQHSVSSSLGLLLHVLCILGISKHLATHLRTTDYDDLDYHNFYVTYELPSVLRVLAGHQEEHLDFK